MENQGQRRIWKPKMDYKNANPGRFGKGVFLPKGFKKKFEEQLESEKEGEEEEKKDLNVIE